MERASPPRSPIPTLSSPPTTVADDVIAMQQAYAVSPAQEAEVVDLSINSPSHQLNRPVADNAQTLRSVTAASTCPILRSPSRTLVSSAPQVTTPAPQPVQVASTSTQPEASSSTQQSTSPAPQHVAGVSGPQSGYSQQADGKYKCKTCDFHTETKSSIVRHCKTHTGMKEHQCQYCSRKFYRKEQKIIHERIHTGEKPFQCQYCDKSFTQQANKITHERIHTDEKPYKCQFCDYAAAQKTVLTDHERTHTGEKPFKCQHCDYAAAQRCNLKYHIRTKHPSQPATPKDDQPPAKKPKTE